MKGKRKKFSIVKVEAKDEWLVHQRCYIRPIIKLNDMSHIVTLDGMGDWPAGQSVQ